MHTTPRGRSVALSLMLATATLLAAGCDRRADDVAQPITGSPSTTSPSVPSAHDAGGSSGSSTGPGMGTGGGTTTGTGISAGTVMGADGSASAPDATASASRP